MKPNNEVILKAILTTTLLILITGCANNKYVSTEPQDNVKNWNQAIRSQNIFPIFPPRGSENLPIGSVFLQNTTLYDDMLTWKEKKEFLPMRNVSTIINVPNNSIKSSEAPIPKNTYTVKNTAGLSAVLPIDGIPFGGIFSSSNKAFVEVEFLETKQFSSTDNQIKDLFKIWANSESGKKQIDDFYNENLSNENLTADQGKRVIRIITALFTAQQINVTISYGNNKISKAEVGAETSPFLLKDDSEASYTELITQYDQKIKEINATIQKNEGETTDSETSKSSNNVEYQKLSAYVQLKSDLLDLKNKEMTKKFNRFVLPGASGVNIAHKDNTIYINKHYNNPIIVGYWAVEYLLDKKSDTEYRYTFLNENYYKLLNDGKLKKHLDSAVDASINTPAKDPIAVPK